MRSQPQTSPDYRIRLRTMASAEPTPTVQYVSQQYGDNVLQQVGIWEMPQQKGGYWIVFAIPPFVY